MRTGETSTDLVLRGDVDPVGATPPVNPLLQLHRIIRGRYPQVIAVAVVVGAICAIAGWMAVPPLYASQGWVRVFATQPRVLYQTEENQMMPMFDGFVRSQAELLRSRRVIDLAVAEPAMRDAGWPGQPGGASELIRALEVNAQRGSALISVTVSHKDPMLAQIASNAVLTAFMRYQEEQEGMTVTDRERRLRENQRLLEAELKTVRESMVRTSDEFDGADVDRLFTSKSDQLAQVDAALARPEMIAAGLAADLAADQPEQPQAATADQQPVEVLARNDQELAQLLGNYKQIESEISARRGRLGNNHPEMKALRIRLDGIRVLLDERAAYVRTQVVDTGMPMAASPMAELRAQREAYIALRARLVEDVRALSRARMRLKSQQEREQEVEGRLNETNTALEAIRVEDEVIRAGRVRIQQRAATPLQPDKDRRLPLAAAGFLGGSGIVVAGFVGMNLVRRRVRFADELESSSPLIPLIGVVPDLETEDPEQQEAAHLALHHVRNSLLMLRDPNRDSSVYLISSALQGEGKTTVAIALATSFAQAGYKVTLIDADLVGRGITHELGLDHQRGLTDCLGVDPDETAFQPGTTGRMRVMPAGQRDKVQAHELTSEEIRGVLDFVRRDSDIVVVDSGPILGSLEAGLFAMQADVMVLLAQRGTSGRLVRAAIDKARNYSRARLIMLFNRAHHSDLTTSASYTSVYSRPINGASPARRTGERSRLLRVLQADEATSEA